MSNKPILLALLAVVVLALATLLVTKMGRSAAEAEAARSVGVNELILDVTPSQVAAVEVATAGRGVERIERGDEPGSWVLRAAKDGAERTWRLDAGSVRAAIRLLCETRAVATPDRAAKIGADATRVTLTLDGGATRTVRLATAALGGQSLAEIAASSGPTTGGAKAEGEPRLAVVPDELQRLFAAAGPMAWREKTLLAGVMSTATRVRIVYQAVSGGGEGGAAGEKLAAPVSVAVGREGGRWMLTEPVRAPADVAAVQRLLTTLEGISVVRYYDGDAPPSATEGLKTPMLRVTIESDSRVIPAGGAGGAGGGEAVSKTVTRELLIAGTADMSGRNQIASVDGGKTVVAIDATSIGALAVDPTRYISPVATPTVPADVDALVLMAVDAKGAASERRFHHTLEGWKETRPDKSEITLGKDRISQITQAFDFLTKAPAQSIKIQVPPAYTKVGTISFRAPSGDEFESIEVGRATLPGLVLHSGAVYRSYGQVAALIEEAFGPATLPPVGGSGQQPAVEPSK